MCQSSFGSYNDKYRLFQGAELRGTMPEKLSIVSPEFREFQVTH
jgi:hypothetical protein